MDAVLMPALMPAPTPAALPRAVPDMRAPNIGKVITAGPSMRDYATAQDAYDAAVHEQRTTDIAVVLDNDAEYGDVVFRTRAPDCGKIVVMPATLPRPGRVGPGMRLPKLTSLTTNGIVRCEDGVHNSYLVGLEIAVPESPRECYVAVDFGAVTPGVLDAQPMNVGINRCYIHGTPATRLRRAVGMNCRDAFVTDSYIDDVHDLRPEDGGTGNGDTQAFACWEGAGPHLYGNDHCRAAGEIILYGGADPSVRGLVPSDITIRRCWLEKPLAWMGRYPCKNDFELKFVRRLLMADCIVEGNWKANQTGVGFVLAAMQNGSADWLTLQDITLWNLFVRNMSSFLTLSAHGTDDIAETLTTRRVSIRNVMGVNINGVEPYDPEHDNRMMVLAGLQDTEIDRVTLLARPGRNTRAMAFAGAPGVRSTVSRSILSAEGSGMVGDGTAPGAGAVAAYLPELGALHDNVLIGVDPSSGVTIPQGNQVAPTIEAVGFADPTMIERCGTAPHDEVLAAFTLRPDSSYLGTGPDVPALRHALVGVMDGTVPDVPVPAPSLTEAQRSAGIAAIDWVRRVTGRESQATKAALVPIADYLRALTP
jgi:hypothetical protein